MFKFEAALPQVAIAPIALPEAIALLIRQTEDHQPLWQQHKYQFQIARCKT
ncbi:hypothetical protein QQ056_00575 [Oscillatoria laete-virens NRMC-F 0139]|nr:hypothetical protein [Oscillatoria laete-virens NRMC-F 0139]